MLDATRKALDSRKVTRAEAPEHMPLYRAALAEVAAAERAIEASRQMRHAAIPVQTHGVARQAVKNFDAALHDLAALKEKV